LNLFLILEYLNGNITAEQANKTIAGDYILSVNETKLMINMHKNDRDFIMQKATTISTYWFIDCKYYGQTNDFIFIYNFTKPNVTHEIGALVIASYDPPMTTTVLPSTTTMAPINVTTIAPNISVANSSEVAAVTSASPMTVTSIKPTMKSTTAIPIATNANMTDVNNISLPYICSNTSLIPPDPNKTYGYFFKKIHVRG